MKTYIFLIVLACAFVSASAQDTLRADSAIPKNRGHWFVSVNGGYAAGIGQQYFNYADTKYAVDTAVPGTTITITQKKGGSLGSGPSARFVLGYERRHWGVELAGTYLWGKTVSYMSEHTSNASSFDNYTDTYSYSLRIINLIPSVTIKSGHKQLYGTLSLGPVLGLAPQITYEHVSTDFIAGHSDHYYYHGRMAWGFASSAGLSYRMGDHFALHADARFTYETYTPVYKSETKSGKTGIGTTSTYNTATGTAKELRSTYNLSSGGIFVGVSYAF